jgi:protein O-mannosyl-transferase
MSFRVNLLNYFHSRDRGWVLSLFLAVCCLYLPFLGSPFVFDDLPFFMSGAANHYAHAWFHFGLRWLPYATLGWTELAFSNVATHFFHLGNLLLHAANVIMLFYLLRQLMAAAISQGDSTNVTWGAWFGALMFALHPVAVYAVGYVVERSILMATFFSLAMLLLYLRGLLTGKIRWLALATIAYFLAVFSKEHSVMMLAVLAALTLMLRGKIKASTLALWLSWGALFAIGLLIVLRAKGVFGTPYEAMAANLFTQQGVAAGSTAMLQVLSVMTQAGLFFKYLFLWVIPNPAWMSIDMREPFVSALSAWQGWVNVGGFALYGLVAAWLLLRGGSAGLAGFALLYPWLQFMVEFSAIRVQEPFVLYRSYLWMPGVMLFVPLLMNKWPGRRTFVVLGISVLILMPLVANRLWVFADNYRLWNDAAQLLPNNHVPGADRIFFNRGQAEEALGKKDEAIDDFLHSLSISPQYAPVHFELGWEYAQKKQYDEAMAQFDLAIKYDPNYAKAYFGKALLLKMQHKNKQAAELMEKSCELNTVSIACLISKGHVENKPAGN